VFTLERAKVIKTKQKQQKEEAKKVKALKMIDSYHEDRSSLICYKTLQQIPSSER